MKLMAMTATTVALAFFAEPASAHQHENQHEHLRAAHYEGSNAVSSVRHFAHRDGQRRTFAAHHLAHHYAEGSASQRTERSARTGAAANAYALAPATDTQTEARSGGYGARPSAWCGWEMRHLVGQDPGPSYNLAANWAHWGRSGPAGIGAVVVWSHHVGKIVGKENGQWVIESGNDGHQTRTRARSISGAIAIRWG